MQLRARWENAKKQGRRIGLACGLFGSFGFFSGYSLINSIYHMELEAQSLGKKNGCMVLNFNSDKYPIIMLQCDKADGIWNIAAGNGFLQGTYNALNYVPYVGLACLAGGIVLGGIYGFVFEPVPARNRLGFFSRARDDMDYVELAPSLGL